MIFDYLDEYIENNRLRKALKGCVEIAFDEGYITIENLSLLWDTLDKYVPADKIETFTIRLDK